VLPTGHGGVGENPERRFEFGTGIPSALRRKEEPCGIDVAPLSTQERFSVMEKRTPGARIGDFLEPSRTRKKPRVLPPSGGRTQA
jgi:hypothetical protein